MTHALVVHHDLDMADQESDWLRRAGFTVGECAGPQYGPCPILHGMPCPAVEEADVLVYDVWATGDSESELDLVERLRLHHPSIPIVLTAPGMAFDWGASNEAAGIVTISGRPSAAALVDAVNRALESVVRPA